MKSVVGVDVQIEPEDVGVVVAEQPLDVVDVLAMPRSDLLRYHVVHALHQHVFIMDSMQIIEHENDRFIEATKA